MKKDDNPFEATLREFGSKLRKQVLNNRVRNLDAVSADRRGSFALGFDSALALLIETAEENGIEKSDLGIGEMPVSSLVNSKI